MAKNTKPTSGSAPARSRTLKLKKETIKDLSTKRPVEVKGGSAVYNPVNAPVSNVVIGSRVNPISYPSGRNSG